MTENGGIVLATFQLLEIKMKEQNMIIKMGFKKENMNTFYADF